jgi:proline dehydrogenase
MPLDIMSIFAGTHNEQSTYDLMTMMKEKSIAANDNRIGLVNCMA